jgi:hypothetical protein
MFPCDPNTVKTQPKAAANNPAIAGQPASAKHIHGDHNRYATFAIHTRGSSVQWFTADAHQADSDGFPAIIRQEATFAAAIV